MFDEVAVGSWFVLFEVKILSLGIVKDSSDCFYDQICFLFIVNTEKNLKLDHRHFPIHSPTSDPTTH